MASLVEGRPAPTDRAVRLGSATGGCGVQFDASQLVAFQALEVGAREESRRRALTRHAPWR